MSRWYTIEFLQHATIVNQSVISSIIQNQEPYDKYIVDTMSGILYGLYFMMLHYFFFCNNTCSKRCVYLIKITLRGKFITNSKGLI